MLVWSVVRHDSIHTANAEHQTLQINCTLNELAAPQRRYVEILTTLGQTDVYLPLYIHQRQQEVDEILNGHATVIKARSRKGRSNYSNPTASDPVAL